MASFLSFLNRVCSGGAGRKSFGTAYSNRGSAGGGAGGSALPSLMGAGGVGGRGGLQSMYSAIAKMSAENVRGAPAC